MNGNNLNDLNKYSHQTLIFIPCCIFIINRIDYKWTFEGTLENV